MGVGGGGGGTESVQRVSNFSMEKFCPFIVNSRFFFNPSSHHVKEDL